MYIDPVLMPAVIEQIDHFFQDFFIGLIHDARYGFSCYPVTDNHDNNRDNDGHDTIQLVYAGKINEDKSDDNSNSGIGIRLQVLPARLQRF